MNKRASSSLSSSSLSSSLFSTMSFMIAFCRRKTASRIDGLYLFVVVMYFGGMYWLSQNLWLELTSVLDSIIRNRDAWPPAPRPRVRHPAARPRPVGPRRVRVISFISGYRWDPGNRTHSTFRLRNTQVVLPKSSTRQEGHHKNKRPPCQSRRHPDCADASCICIAPLPRR